MPAWFVRTMWAFHMYRYAPVFVEQCNRMDEVWVACEFARQVLVQSGESLCAADVIRLPGKRQQMCT